MADRKYQCNCCGFRTLTVSNGYEICPVCFWEDDPVQNEDLQYSGGANSLSLEETRHNYIEMGASQREFLNRVRPPTLEEMPIPLAGLDKDIQAQIQRQAKIHILATLRGMLSGRINVVDGCDCITTMASQLDAPWDDKLRIFEGIMSECDQFPRRSVRHEWERDALARKDLEMAQYADRIRETVLSACHELEMPLKAELRRPITAH
jgi:hypothetical protein